MSARRIEWGETEARVDPIAAIARQERRAQARGPAAPPPPEDGPDLVPAASALAPQGMAGVVDRALGRVTPPPLLKLADALDDLQRHADALIDIDPALAEVASAVLTDERMKVMRYVDLKDQ